MNRFYIQPSDIRPENNSEPQALKATLTDADDLKHMQRVLRLGIGDQVEICDGQGREYLGTIEQVGPGRVDLTLLGPLDIARELPCEVWLFQGITKGQKWDYLIQKAVEAGVHHIVPVAMARSVSKISDEKADKKTDRWQKIADEAAKQSKRGVLPVFHGPQSFKEALSQQEDFDLVLTAYEGERHNTLKTVADRIVSAKRIALWVGPEGGIDAIEASALSQAGTLVTLGRRILRTETAPVVLLAQLSYLLETS